jgi:multicomponent Na+:H+ antiporter subunit A
LSDSPLWFWSLLIVGGITMLLGAISAIRYYDMKALLAYATVSQLGVLVMLLAFRDEAAYVAVAVGILAHALYKGPLFMVAGIVDHATGTRDLRRLAGLARPLLWATVTSTLAGLSLAGIPPTFGFVAKETLLETLYHYMEHTEQAVGALALVATLIVGAFFVAASFTLLWEAFYRKQADAEDPAHVHHGPAFSFVAGPLVLTLIGAAIPLTLSQVGGLLFAPAASSIGHEEIHLHLKLWHGLTPTFGLSMVAIASGVGLFFVRNWLRTALNALPAKLSSDYGFDRIDKGLYALADWSTKTVQGGTLATQASIVMLIGISVLFFSIVSWDLISSIGAEWASSMIAYEALTVALIIFAALGTVRAQTRLTGIVSIGVVGIGVTLFFVFFSAPDLALTQLLVEVLTVVLLILVFYRIPPETRPDMGLSVVTRNWVMAILAGIFGFTLALVASGGAYAPSISDYFLINSIAGGHGANVVNVILVDFRGYDTMGEMTVLAIAALGGYALLRSPRFHALRKEPLRRPKSSETDANAPSQGAADSSEDAVKTENEGDEK